MIGFASNCRVAFSRSSRSPRELAHATVLMSAPGFVHLRLHSEFAIADGTVRIDDAVAAAAADRMPALALTDLANAFGLVKFYKAARAAGVKPLYGVDAWISNDTVRDQPTRALLLAQSR